MITEEKLLEEIKVTIAFKKAMHEAHADEDFPELQGYLDGLIFAWKGKLD